jgi:putative ABC transport system permease protein
MARRLPAGLTVEMPGSHGEMAHSTMLAAEQGLSALGVLALVAAVFGILNTFLLELSERRHQLALLKVLGATRFQILRPLLVEAVLLGLAGTVLGCVLGTSFSLLLTSTMGRFLNVGLPAMRLRVGPYLLAGFLGPVLPLLAVFWPAWLASRRAPLNELLQHRDGQERLPWWIGGAGVCLLAAGLVPAFGVCRGQFSSSTALPMQTLAIVVLLTGGVLALPVLFQPILRVIGRLPLRVESQLALQQLARHGTRTGLTAGVLFLGVTAMVGFGQSLDSILDDVRGWYRKTIVADFLVRASMPDSSFLLSVGLPDSLASDLGQVNGVQSVDRIAFVPGRVNGHSALILARTFASDQPLPLDLREGEQTEVREGLLRGEIVLGTGLAGQLHLHRGDTLSLAGSQGPVRVRIAGTTTEFAGGGSALYLEWVAAQRLLGVSAAHLFLIRANRSGGSADAALRDFCSRHELLLQSNAKLRALIDRLLNCVSGATWGLMLLVFVVACSCTVSTMLMNVQEQTPVFRLLRVLGLSRPGIRRLVRRQAMLLGLLSILPGALAGLGLSYMISKGSSSWAGVAITFRPKVLVLVLGSGVALVSVLLSAAFPAQKATRNPRHRRHRRIG